MKIRLLVIGVLLAVLNVGFSVETVAADKAKAERVDKNCLLYTSPSPRDS